MDDDAAIAGNDIDRLNRLEPALGMKELQRDLPAGVDVDPMVGAIDP